MLHFAEMTDEEKFARLEHKAAETKKLLLGALLLVKDSWKEELSRSEEGLDIIEAIELAEESFPQGPQPDRFKRLDSTLGVINQRAKAIFDLTSYIAKYGKRDQK